MKTRCWCSSTAEQLICNQQVAGSIPIASSAATRGSNDKITKRSVRFHDRVHRRIGLVPEGFPSGQREQTVNLSPLASKVRILPPPPPTANHDGNPEKRIGDAFQRGSSSVGRAPAFQAGRRGFEPRLPLCGQAASPKLRRVWKRIQEEDLREM
jgi:hypothetical protein